MGTQSKRLVIWAAVSKPDKRALGDNDVKDKYSLKDQELMGRAFAKAHDFEIVKVFLWPGHSRDESDVIQALEDFAAAGRREYHELREMWRSKAFDVLWCHNHSRLGRSFTLQSWVIENVVRSGAEIYRHVGGWIDKSDYGGQIALGGFANAQERERRIVQNDAGLTARAAKGLNVNRVPFPHRLIRDPRDGKALRMEVDPTNRRFLNDLHDLLMDSVSFKLLGRELFLRFGHVNPSTGNAWGHETLYNMLHRPSFWGHTARKFRTVLSSLYRDGWGFDTDAPVPPGVVIFRDTHEPAYTSQQAENVKSVLRYRKTIKGSITIKEVHPLSGLVHCPECNRVMQLSHTSAKHVHYYYLRCPTHWDNRYYAHNRDCNNTIHLRDKLIQGLIEQILARAFAGENFHDIIAVESTTPAVSKSETVQAAIENQKQLIDRLILQSAQAGDTVSLRYTKLIEDAGKQLDLLESEYLRLTYEAQAEREDEAQRQFAIDQLREIPFENLWSHNGPTINRLLKDFFGRYTIYALDGVLIGVNLKPARRPYQRH